MEIESQKNGAFFVSLKPWKKGFITGSIFALLAVLAVFLASKIPAISKLSARTIIAVGSVSLLTLIIGGISFHFWARRKQRLPKNSRKDSEIAHEILVDAFSNEKEDEEKLERHGVVIVKGPPIQETSTGRKKIKWGDFGILLTDMKNFFKRMWIRWFKDFRK